MEELEINISPIEATLVVGRGIINQEDLKLETFRSDKALIESILGGINEVWLGRPKVFSLVRLANAGYKVPNYYLSQTDKYDFFLAQFACSFRPATGCEFTKATVEVSLKAYGARSNPTALDIFPKEIYIGSQYKRTLKFGPSVGISLEKVAEVKAGVEASVANEFVKYDGEISGFVGSEEFGWDFNKSRIRPIVGVKELFVLIQADKGSTVKAKFNVKADIRTKLGFIPLPQFLDAVDDEPLLRKEYDLTQLL